jgi:hypothetical protein
VGEKAEKSPEVTIEQIKNGAMETENIKPKRTTLSNFKLRPRELDQEEF